MPIKIQTRLKVLKLLEETREDFKQNINETFAEELKKQIEKGISPVKKSGNKFTQYSESYVKAIKSGNVPGKTKASPVDLKQTGEMLNSIKIDISGENPRVFFSDPKLPGSKFTKSEIHNNEGVTRKDVKKSQREKKGATVSESSGGGYNVKRRLLPTESGEEFNFVLFQRILEALKEAIKKVTKDNG